MADTGTDFGDLVLFGFMTGCRPQEVRGLQKRHLRQDANGRWSILLEKHKTARIRRDHAPRSIPLSSEAEDIVRRQMERHPESEFIFLNDDGCPYTGRTLRQRFQRWCKRASILKYPPYAMRHTFASQQADAGINSITLGNLLGHTAIRTTMRYVRDTDEPFQKAVETSSAHIMELVSGDSPKSITGEKVATKVATNFSLGERKSMTLDVKPLQRAG